MAETKQHEIETTSVLPERAFKLWVGILLPPAAWATQLQTVYLTSEYGCVTSDFFWNHFASAIALTLSVFGGYLAFAEWTSERSRQKRINSEGLSRRGFMAILGMLLSGLFSLIIVAQWLPTILGVPCAR